jgi:hypothetical protein
MATRDPKPVVADQTRSLQLHMAVADLLHELGKLAGYVTDLTSTHQRGVGYLDDAGRLALDKLVRTERAARFPTTEYRELGQKFMLGVPTSLGTGQVRAAGNIAAISADAELTATLQHLTRRLVKTLVRDNAPVDMPRLPADPSIVDRLHHLYELSWLTNNTRILGEIERDLTASVDALNSVIDGAFRKQHPDPCPHCGRHTLVAYFHEEVIRCVRPEHGEPCVCGVDNCPCKYDATHVHEWHQRRNGWELLAAQIQDIKDTAAADETVAELTAVGIPQTPTPEKTVRPQKVWDLVDDARSVADTDFPNPVDHEAEGCLTWMRYSPTQVLYGCTHPTGHDIHGPDVADEPADGTTTTEEEPPS